MPSWLSSLKLHSSIESLLFGVVCTALRLIPTNPLQQVCSHFSVWIRFACHRVELNEERDRERWKKVSFYSSSSSLPVMMITQHGTLFDRQNSLHSLCVYSQCSSSHSTHHNIPEEINWFSHRWDRRPMQTSMAMNEHDYDDDDDDVNVNIEPYHLLHPYTIFIQFHSAAQTVAYFLAHESWPIQQLLFTFRIKPLPIARRNSPPLKADIAKRRGGRGAQTKCCGN